MKCNAALVVVTETSETKMSWPKSQPQDFLKPCHYFKLKRKKKKKNLVLLAGSKFVFLSNTCCQKQQVVYILDQVKALEEELILRIKQQGLNYKPQILVVSLMQTYHLFLHATKT
jgi:hypothetical protein